MSTKMMNFLGTLVSKKNDGGRHETSNKKTALRQQKISCGPNDDNENLARIVLVRPFPLRIRGVGRYSS